MRSVLKFELLYRAKQPSTYLFFGIMFLFSFLFVTTNVVEIGGAGAQVNFNSPLVIARVAALLTAIGSIMVSAIAGTAIYRDFETNVHELLFTTRMSKFAYLGGRFLGSYLWILVVFSGILWGLFIGAHMPWVDKSRLGPFHFSYYLQPFLIFIVPNMLFLSCVLFTLGMLTRSLLAIYVQGVALLVGYLVARSLISDLDNRKLANLLDIYGNISLQLQTMYWTQFQRNTQLVHLDNYLLLNRLLWIAVGLGVFAIGCSLFRFSSQPITLSRTKTAVQPKDAVMSNAVRSAFKFSAAVAPRPWQQFLQLVRSYFTESVRSVAFICIAGFGIINVILNISQAHKSYGTSIYPVTHIVLDTIFNSFIIYFIILITFYSGELTWKERVLKLDQVQDALPVPTSTVFLAKVTTVIAMQLCLLVALAIAGMGVQIGNGYYNLEPGLYAVYLLLFAFPYLALMVVGSFFIHALVNNKFLGHTLVIACYVLGNMMPYMGLGHHMLVYGATPSPVYSDMNGWGPYAAPIFWFYAYWSAFAVLVVVATLLIWVRGTEQEFGLRLKMVPNRLNPTLIGISGSALLVFICLGGFIYYNTCVLNRFRTDNQQKALSASCEKRYKHYEDVPMPRITDAVLQADIYPERQQFAIRGVYTLRNTHPMPVSQIYLNFNVDLTVRSVMFDHPARRLSADKDNGIYIYALGAPLEPGAQMTMTFDTPYLKRGFKNDNPNTDIAANGSFLSDYVPSIGYQPDSELTGDDDRRKQGLPPRAAMHPITDIAARQNTYISNDSDWIHLDSTVSTSPDQTAISPGYLQQEWTQNGRRYFHYKMDAPIRNFYTFLSGRYTVKRDKWRNVNLEIYYDKDHPYDVDRMMLSLKKSLAYYTANFGPYQFHQMRIIEFPDYQDFAQSFPNTVPYSENLGFIAKVDGKDDIDYPFSITAHEVAHQWWAHQVIGADCQGSEMLSETLAQYSALMVMKHDSSAQNVRRFLKYQLDQYLHGRAGEQHEEQPLAYCEDEPYIHYAKGALVMYEMSDMIGEDKVNAALRKFLHDYAFKQPPYPTSLDLLQDLRQVTPPDKQYLIHDLFLTITLFNNRVETATYKKTGPNTYHVTMILDAEKDVADGRGKETKVPLHDYADVGVFAKPGKDDDLGAPLYFKTVLITQPQTKFECDVVGLPSKGGIDPYNKLIDLNSDDNTMPITQQ